jgi:hypothetical protein
MKKITITLPEPDQVEYRLEVLGEDTSIQDQRFSPELEKQILDSANAGNIYAWFIAKVTADWKGVKGVDYLGGCSYESEENFKACGYWEDLKQSAYDDLINQLELIGDKESPFDNSMVSISIKRPKPYEQENCLDKELCMIKDWIKEHDFKCQFEGGKLFVYIPFIRGKELGDTKIQIVSWNSAAIALGY